MLHPARLLSFLLLSALLTAPALAAEELAKPTEKAGAQPVKEPEKVTHEAQASLAGLFATGNINSLAGKATAHYQLRAWQHGLRVEGLGGLTGLAENSDGVNSNGFETPLDQNIDSAAAGKLRYDYFFSELDSGYTSVFGGHDSAANLGFRFRGEAGYRRYFFNQKKHALSAELGAVYVIDQAPFDGDTNSDGEVNLSDKLRFEENNGSIGARLMLGYVNALSEDLAFTQQLEVITNLWPELEAPYEQARVDAGADNKIGIGEATTLASKTSLGFALSKDLALSVNLDVLYDFAAIARRDAMTNHDISTSLALTYKLF